MPLRAAYLCAFLMPVVLLACQTKSETQTSEALPLKGTWELISGRTVEKGDTLFTDYRKNEKTIKIINDTHFSFLRHDLVKGKDTAAVFVAGGGSYKLAGNAYTEFLEYCNDRQWEGNKFDFTVAIKGDTLIQTGVEKVANLGIDRVITETYLRVRE
ncbi:hypothetical protein [Larkinella soli]|uniref:hypothetical protein n=1 Tax=Larkinella soli TaxID=1770527 RepID=UPI000FFB45DC|nr:hypothetical protein [Larkinella soli]